MDYVDAAQARTMTGLRLALTKGVPGPWSESAKSVFHVKGIPFTPVAQYGGGQNEDLVAWTGHRNAPVAVYNDEPPRSGWLEILMLAERLAPEHSLLPADLDARVEVIGLSNEICGEGGFGWCRRTFMFPDRSVSDEALGEALSTMRNAYGFWGMAPAESAERCAGIMRHLSARLWSQKLKDRPYLFGEQLTCADIYWASFSQLVEPLPEEVNPMPPFVRKMYATAPDPVKAAFDPLLRAHRDFIFQTHLVYPLQY
ncbi:MAG: hypothetical protein ACFB6R_05405 [Alphaproteobacteria bacterium]